MTQKIEKFYQTVDLPDIYAVSNFAFFSNRIYIATTDADRPILRYDVDSDGDKYAFTNPEPIEFNVSDIRFIGFIDNHVLIIPKHKWVIHVDDDRTIKIPDFKSRVIELLRRKNCDICKDEQCYHLVGFIQLRDFNLFVQLACVHSSQMMLFVLKLGLKDFKCVGEIEVLKVFDNFIDKSIEEDDAKSLMFTGLCHVGKKVFLISTTYAEKNGYLWEMPYYGNIAYLGAPILVSKLRRSPKGICSDGKNLMVLCNAKKKEFGMYIIKKIELG